MQALVLDSSIVPVLQSSVVLILMSNRRCVMCRFSIHCTDKRPGELKAAEAAFPMAWPGTDGIYHLGYTSKARGRVLASPASRPHLEA